MKILWICNVMLPQIAEANNLASVPTGGWLSGAAEQLVKSREIQLCVCFPMHSAKEPLMGMAGNMQYFGYPASAKLPHVYDPETERWLRMAVQEFKPDIVHIWGTEFPHTLAMTRAFGCPEKTLINIQGLCGVCAKHYTAALPHSVQMKYTFRDLLRLDRIWDQKRKFEKRGQFEQAALQNTGHIIGRTCWDKACTEQVAPDAKYHFCNETLREEFYRNAGKWDPAQCERHSIFVSQAVYPVKGFHHALEAMPEILKRYPDAKLYTTGTDPRELPFYRISAYQQWLAKLIRKNGLEERVVYLGTLDEEQMCHRFLKSNVFVSASSIENSPNSVGEAMLLGVPTVASFVGGTMDLLEDKAEGYLYQADAPYMLAHYVCKVFDDSEAAREMGRRASEHAKKTHDRDENLKQLLRIYHEVFGL